MIIPDSSYLVHFGILRKSGRYPWGSGGTQEKRNRTFLDMVGDLKRKGMSEKEIADGFGITTTQLRSAKSIAKNAEKQANIDFAQRLRDKGTSNVAIAKRMNLPESTVRALLAPGEKHKADVLEGTANMLKEQVAQKKYVDIGAGVEHHLGISSTKLSTAVARLLEEGYKRYYVKVEQLGTGKQTTLKVLASPDTPYGEVFRNRGEIKQIRDFSNDGGKTFLGLEKPLAISPGRVAIRYAEQGGADADGVIYVRPGVKDVSLDGSRYAQVRIQVGDGHYLKGMAMYKDDLPDGVDLMFNTNKSNTGNKLDAMKPLKRLRMPGDVKDKHTGPIDTDNPFGAVIDRQVIEVGRGGKNKVTSAMNIVNEEGNWQKWSKSLSSQVLSKQSPALAKTQLDMTFDRKKRELDEIMSLTNPAVRKRLLDSYADDVDSSAVLLKAAALPRQGSHVILPVNSMKENEIYAPNYRNGERVALIRYPHGGVFEIPELTVNNRHPEARKLLGNSPDAVGINHKVAQKLSGADFDGDTVLVIPNNDKRVKSAPALEGLKDFDPQLAFPGPPEMAKMNSRQKALEMGDVSNLITDMTIKGANTAELARAVRHSMVVIDAEKHGLDWKASAKANGIGQLKQKYQGGTRAGAATLISRATSRKDVAERIPRSAAKGGPVDKITGKKVFEETGGGFVDSKGKFRPNMQRSTKLAETEDARTLVSKDGGTPIERVYADHSNKLKALANQARKEVVNTKTIDHSPSARATYSKEVASLNAKLVVAQQNAPLERQAQVIANAIFTQRRQANPDLEADEIKKLKSQALKAARERTGARKQRIEITDSEWAAIQAGALRNTNLNAILSNTDLDQVKKLATPKADVLMTPAKQQRAAAMATSGYTQAEIADAIGVSLTTLKRSFS